MKKIGYLGPRGSFTEAAARKYAGLKPVELVCCTSLPEIVAAVEHRSLDQGIVPLENSTEGSVGEVLDLVARAPGILFSAEVVLKIDHCLMAKPGTVQKEIERVLSHSQALSQCRGYLAKSLPGVLTVETVSTSQAAGTVASCSEPWAAIGTNLAAEIYGLEVLESSIQDCSDNATRFMVLGKKDAVYSPNSQTSLVVAANDQPGALYSILREFTLREINLSRIESRPVKKKLGQYLFFIDLEGHRSEPEVQSAIEALSGNVQYLKILGSYTRDLSQATVKDTQEDLRESASLQEIRKEIDVVDSQIVELIAIRTKLVEKMVPLKGDASKVQDPVREDAVLKQVRSLALLKGAHPETIEKVFRMIISQSVDLQRETLIKSIDR